MSEFPKFRVEKLTKHVTRIFAHCGEMMYLVEGEDRAALLDTGSGIGSLRECVDELTDKPIVVLITHGHIDHAMGAIEFDEVYMSPNDAYIYRQHGDMAFRQMANEALVKNNQLTSLPLLQTLAYEKIKPFKEGDVFDLGGVSVVIYDCVGHTKGSVVMLIPEERAVLLGDACNNFTFLFDDYSTSVATYERSLRDLKEKITGKYDTVYLSHGDGNGHKEMIEDVIEVCEDIQKGNTDDIPFEFMGRKCYIAKALDADLERVNGRGGNIVYNKEKVG